MMATCSGLCYLWDLTSSCWELVFWEEVGLLVRLSGGEVAGPGGSQGYGHGLGLRWVWGSTVGGRGNGKQILNWLYRACIALLRGPA